jgi:uncharacterized protein (TIGR02646 family)
MRLILKRPEPPELLAYRKTPGARYAGLPADAKQAVRQALVREQYGLCCFCMQRVQPTVAPSLRVKIAHWTPQAVDASQDLAWHNLYAACAGNEGAPRERQHCDTRQGNEALTLHPGNTSHVSSLRYTTQGEVHSNRDDLQADIETRLNLNDAALCAQRREAVLRMADALGRRSGQTFRRTEIERAMVRCETPDAQGYLPPFAGALMWWLRCRAPG